MTATTLRPELPEPTRRIARLRVDERGYPVPWFVAWMDDDGDEVDDGDGHPDHRVMSGRKIGIAIREHRCWICGDPLGAHRAFAVGPMCVVNRNTAEPPAHRDCAEWSARACPFLTRPHAHRRDAGKPETATEPAGIMLHRNPGVIAIYVTRKHRIVRVEGGVLFRLGDPESVRWMAEGRDATRAEVEASLESGLPALRELAEQSGPSAVRGLELLLETSRELLPAA